MDLQKMNPLARKMMVHSEAFTKALEDGNANAARDHITEVLKFAEYLSHDVSGHIAKAEDIGFTLEPVMVRKMNEVVKNSMLRLVTVFYPELLFQPELTQVCAHTMGLLEDTPLSEMIRWKKRKLQQLSVL